MCEEEKEVREGDGERTEVSGVVPISSDAERIVYAEAEGHSLTASSERYADGGRGGTTVLDQNLDGY